MFESTQRVLALLLTLLLFACNPADETAITQSTEPDLLTPEDAIGKPGRT